MSSDSNNDLKNLLEIIAKALVDKPSEVKVTETEAESGILLSLSVCPDDMGKVIGKQGRIAKSIRSLVRAAAIHKNIRVNVEIGQK